MENNYEPKQSSLEAFDDAWSDAAQEAYLIAVDHGFWPDGVERNVGEIIALIHSELSETLEAYRHGNPPSTKAPGFSQVEEELADCIIRIQDLAHGLGLDVGGAYVSKMQHNAQRPHKHGKEF